MKKIEPLKQLTLDSFFIGAIHSYQCSHCSGHGVAIYLPGFLSHNFRLKKNSSYSVGPNWQC